jgi:NDP-sugar pyrophosphorylase family protein
MQVLVPIGPRDSYFPESEYFFPKPLVEIRGKPMIERAIAPLKRLRGVNGPVRFLFVTQEEDCSRFSLDNVLRLITDGQAEVIRLKSPTEGAVCSCLMAVDRIDPEDALIVVNSDQVIDAEIRGIVRDFAARDLDAAVITFASVHPRWSYVLTDSDWQVIQAAEKRVISNRAIAGFYYYRHARDFLDTAKTVILNGQATQGRYFVSETLNELILRGRRVGHTEIPASAYHNLYSPQKVLEYEARLDQTADHAAPQPGISLVIPMAGEGARFAQAGYTLPKPFIDVAGKPMIERVLDNVRLPGASVTLIARGEHITAEPTLARRLEARGCRIVTLDKTTEGTACTLLHARSQLSEDAPLMIANCDQVVDFDCAEFVADCFARGLDGSILVFREPDLNPKWSYARIDEQGIVVEVAEKKAISDLATVGIYLFRTARLFIDSAIDMIARNDRVNNEFYTCPVYNYAIRAGARIGVFEVPRTAMQGLGTPEDLQRFLDLLARLKSGSVRADNKVA